MALLTQQIVEKGESTMDNLLKAIYNSKMNKQDFAEAVKIPYYRVAEILYGNATLTKEEKSSIIGVFGNNIFL